MSTILITAISAVLTAVLGGGAVKGFLDFLSSRRQDKIKYSESAVKTLYELNSTLKKEIQELRTELKRERILTRNLEKRVAQLERDLEDRG